MFGDVGVPELWGFVLRGIALILERKQEEEAEGWSYTVTVSRKPQCQAYTCREREEASRIRR